MAQPGSALAWGARGRRFESFHTDHFFDTKASQYDYSGAFFCSAGLQSFRILAPKRALLLPRGLHANRQLPDSEVAPSQARQAPAHVPGSPWPVGTVIAVTVDKVATAATVPDSFLECGL